MGALYHEQNPTDVASDDPETNFGTWGGVKALFR